MIGESRQLNKIIQKEYILNKTINLTPTGGTIRDVSNLASFMAGVSTRPIYVETSRGAVQVNRCDIDDPNTFSLYYNDERIRTLPYSRGRLDHSWRFYPEQMVFAKDTTKEFLTVYDRKGEG